jgi:hypothetical protein
MRSTLDHVEKELAKCAAGATTDACIAARDDAASDLHQTTYRAGRQRYLCKPKSEELALAKRTNDEMKLVLDRAGALDAKWQSAVGEQAWSEAMGRAYKANPVPCLSIVCKEWM